MVIRSLDLPPAHRLWEPGVTGQVPIFSSINGAQGKGRMVDWSEGFVAVDWGTTNRRAYLIDHAGTLRDVLDLHTHHVTAGMALMTDAVVAPLLGVSEWKAGRLLHEAITPLWKEH